MTTLMTKRTTRLLLNSLFAVIALWLATVTPTQAATMASDFDHLATGFPLTGGHSRQECEACHLQGIFKGTPRQCERCHVQGSNRALTFKPNTHVQTTRPCDQCHTSNVTWLGARFDHVGVVPGGCPTCHNGVSQMGKPTSGHPVTLLPCDSCHRSTAWLPAYFDHNGVAPHDCVRCHATAGQQQYVQRPSNHIPLSAGTVIQCDWCHRAGTTWTVSTFNHAATQGVIPGQCATCHNGIVLNANAKPSGINHIPTTGSAGDPNACDTCHNTHNWTPAFTHSAAQGVMPGGCSTCHSGTYAALNVQGKGSGHPNNSAEVGVECDTCHKQFTNWSFQHTAAPVGSGCAGCHNGGYAGNYPAGHFPATSTSIKSPKDCDACHTSQTAGGWATSKHHASSDLVTGGCYVCHSGAYNGSYNAKGTAQKKGHANTGTESCDDCHNTTSFNN